MNYTTPAGSTYRIFSDMLKQTHILIAGATGSGKSTIVNGIITNALYKSPCEVGFILIDPKRVELRDYADLPHTLSYTSRIEHVPQALRAVRQTVEARLADMERRRLRMYDGSDIYVIIDELMPIMVNRDIRAEALPLLQELLAISRCARVRVIACTQSPVVAVLPTPLKCNFDSRVALKTATAQDSRNIIGQKGCELFPDPQTEGRAWAYYRHGCTTDLYDVPRYTDAERQRVIEHWTGRAHIFAS